LPQWLKDAADQSPPQQAAQLRQIIEKADQHMKQWLAKGRSA
jgi:succinate dehydrogenase flavin-adding protein (antitoxin of CptAB toxin-antitoxin module)